MIIIAPIPVLLVTILVVLTQSTNAFAPNNNSHVVTNGSRKNIIQRQMSDWNGEVVSNTEDGRIRGCSITQVEGSISEWIVNIDGVEADLGKFSDAIYRKITADAKQQQFQGFRPGTIPPHLLPTYIGFSMDECAREATLEAMSQNNIRPFDDVRTEMKFSSISILPAKKKSKKKKKKKNKIDGATAIPEEKEEDLWKSFETMKEAISAGWKPGQSFSFVAYDVKGQQLVDQKDNAAKKIGAAGSALDLNSIKFDGE